MRKPTRRIPLTQGKYAIVSPEDFDFLSAFKWKADKITTSYGNLWHAERLTGAKPRVHIQMHREVARRAGLPISKYYDHKDRNGLNNIRSNIRPCTISQNGANSTKRTGTSSKFKGVHWVKHQRCWMARIQVKKVRLYLGSFQSEIEAHAAYKSAAIHYFGEFAAP